MAERYDDQQRQIIRDILVAAMRMLREDVPLEQVRAVFGENWKIGSLPGNPYAREHRFERAEFPRVAMRLYIADDPDDFRKDRRRVKMTPTYFQINFTPVVEKLARQELEALLQLHVGSYHFPDGEVFPYNRFPADPVFPYQEPYAYQALPVPGSKYPVDVDIEYIRPGAIPPEQGGSTESVLASIRIHRAYPIMTAEERKQKERDMPVAMERQYGRLPMSGDMCQQTGMYIPVFPDGRHYVHPNTGRTAFSLAAGSPFPDVPIRADKDGQDGWEEAWWIRVE